MTQYRHRKRGTVYDIITTAAMLQCSTAPPVEKMFSADQFTVYRNPETGAIWIRPTAEFMDGRFDAVDGEPSKDGGEINQ